MVATALGKKLHFGLFVWDLKNLYLFPDGKGTNILCPGLVGGDFDDVASLCVLSASINNTQVRELRAYNPLCRVNYPKQVFAFSPSAANILHCNTVGEYAIYDAALEVP